MKCAMCDNQKVLKAKKTTVKYKESGLDNVILHGVKYFKCPKCGEIYYSFGDVEQLHALIASILISKRGLLSGMEIRFLRTYLGYSSTVFAKLTGCKKETMSRLENEKQKSSVQFDRLVRSLVYEKLPNRDYDLHDLWLNEKELPLKNIELRPDKHGWVAKAA